MITSFRHVYDLLTAAQRKQAVWLVLVMLLLALIQVGAVTSVMPFMGVVADPEILERNRWLAWLYEKVGLDRKGFLIFLGCIVLGAVVVTNGVSALAVWMTTRFICGINASLSSALLRKYLGRSYLWYVQRGSADAGIKVLSEVETFGGSFLHPLLQVIAKGATGIFLVALIVIVDWKVAITATVIFGGSYGAVYLAVRRKLTRIGEERVEANQLRYKTVQEAFGAFKEMKVFQREEHFVKAYDGPTHRFNHHVVVSSLIRQLPRHFLETLAFGGLVALVVYLLASARDIRHIFPVLALYAFAAYRLMPALQVCFGCMTTLRFHHYLLESLHDDFYGREGVWENASSRSAAPVDEDAVPLSFRREIRFENVSFRYPGAAGPAIREATFTISRRTMVAFCGVTGSGKTTIADLLLGLFPVSHGAILVDGVALTERNLCDWRKCVGYVPQHIFLSDESLLRNIAFGLPEEEIDVQAVERAAKAAQIHGFITTSLPKGYGTIIGERGIRLSGGQRQRLGIARALYHDPEVLIFDEATSALDVRTETLVMEAIRDAARIKTVILIAHRLSTVRDCERIFVVEDGQVVEQGHYRELVDLKGTFNVLASGG